MFIQRTGYLSLVILLASLTCPALDVLAQAPADLDPESGFKSIFDGKSLDGWDGDPKLWKVENGVIHGSTQPKGLQAPNTFLIWRGGQPANFELKAKFKLVGGNSGIQYRSKDLGDWHVGGYQAEIRNGTPWPGYLYHERGPKGRGRLSMVGQFTVIGPNGQRQAVQVAPPEQVMKEAGYKPGDWNEYHIIARGNHVIHKINGVTITEFVDTDTDNRCMKGIIAFQMHRGGPMDVYFKDVRLKEYSQKFGDAVFPFNGKDLNNWQVFPPAAVEAGTWSVKDGMLHNAGKPAGYIRTKTDYTSYVLRLQMQHLTKGNSGVLLRLIGQDKIWPRSIECQGQKDRMGDIWNIDQFPMKVDPDRTKGRHTRMMHETNEKPVGQWNQYEIVLDGPHLRIYVNGLLQNWGEDCLVTPGKIALQSEGAQLNFRNIVLIPILDAGR